MIRNVKNFLTENSVIFLLGISSVSLLGIFGGLLFSSNNQSAVIKQSVKRKKPNKKTKTKKINLDPVIDNIYWSIASFAVYYSIYLGLRHSGYKEQAVWLIPALVVLGKLGLITFSSFYYQKNSFLQNLNKSINPAYFIHQDIYQIILALIGYLGLVALIYFDQEKEPEQQPQLNQILNQNNHNQNGEENNKSQINNGNIIQSKPEMIIPNINVNVIQNQNVQIKNLENNEQIELNKLAKTFRDAVTASLKNLDFNEIIKVLENKKIFILEDFIKKIEQGILNKKIDASGIDNLIQIMVHKNFLLLNYTNYFERNLYQKQPLLNRFFYVLFTFYNFNVEYENSEQGKKEEEFDDNKMKEMIDFYLTELTNNLSNEKINSLKEMIDELNYFDNCVMNLFLKRVEKAEEDKKYDPSTIAIVIFFTKIEDIKNFHLKLLRKLVKDTENENFFAEQRKQSADECEDIESFHRFLNDNKINIKRNVFREALYSNQKII